MMIVFVENVYPEGEEYFNGAESWIPIQFKSGLRVELYSQEGYYPKKYIKKNADFLIHLSWKSLIIEDDRKFGYILSRKSSTEFILDKVGIEEFNIYLAKNSHLQPITGIYRSRYIIPEKYLKSDKSYNLPYYALENSDGIFIFSGIERYIKIPKDTEIYIYIDKFYLLAIALTS